MKLSRFQVYVHSPMKFNVLYFYLFLFLMFIPIFTERRPTFGCQVVVQSEQEKLLLKQARKEEKKINKWLAKEEEVEEEPVFDPLELRAKRWEIQIPTSLRNSCKFFH